MHVPDTRLAAERRQDGARSSRSQIAACSAAGSGAGGEPVVEPGERNPGLDRFAFGPLVAVDPDLDRVGK